MTKFWGALRSAILLQLLVGVVFAAAAVFIFPEQAHAADGTISVTVRYQGAARPGRLVYLDGVLKGETNASGKLQFKAKAGSHLVSALYPNVAGGAASVQVVGNKTTSLALALTDEGLGSVFPGKLTPDPLKVTPATTKLTFQFRVRSGAVMPIKGLYFARLQQDVTAVDTDISDRFVIRSDGALTTKAGANLSDILSVNGDQTLSFYLDLGKGASTEVDVVFRVSRIALTGTLAAPPSNHALPLGSIPIKLTQLDTGRVFLRTSNSSGKFNFGLLAAGNYSVESSRKQNGNTFTSIGTFALSADSKLTLTLLGLTDWKNNVTPVTVTPATTTAVESGSPPRRPESGTVAAFSSSSAPSLRAITPVEVTATAGTRDVGVAVDGTVNIPKGTKTINLEYEVKSPEYPTYVTQQSVYNDQWSIVVLSATGAVLFSQAQSVNNQLTQEPVWKTDGTTGPIVKIFDVTSLAATAATKLTVIVTAKNIGDSAYSTSIHAVMPANVLSLDIVNADGQPATMTNPGGKNGGVDVSNAAGYFSFPRPTNTNTFEKGFRVKLMSPTGMKLTHLTQIRVIGIFGTTEYRIYTGAPIVVPGQPNVFFVPATFGHANTANSNVVSVPPPTLKVKFRIEADGTFNAKALTGDIESKELFALYKMPDGFTRYSNRDAATLGSDDWATRGTYLWLNHMTSTSLPPINDISGEHGLSDRGNSHKRGVNIDMFQFEAGTNPGTAEEYYTTIKRAAKKVAANPNDTVALGTLSAWASAQRTGLTSLVNAPGVRNVHLIFGQGEDPLVAGWGKHLICFGKLLRVGKPPVDVVDPLPTGGCPTHTGVSVVYEQSHNNHIHVELPVEYNGAGIPATTVSAQR